MSAEAAVARQDVDSDEGRGVDRAHADGAKPNREGIGSSCSRTDPIDRPQAQRASAGAQPGRPSSEWTSETRAQRARRRARRTRLDAERRQLERMAAEGNAWAIACLAAPEEE